MTWRACVVGGGPVGRLLAALLAGAGGGGAGDGGLAGGGAGGGGEGGERVCLVARGRAAAELAAAGRVRLLVPGEAPTEAPVRVVASAAEAAGVRAPVAEAGGAAARPGGDAPAGGRLLFVVAVKGRDTEAVAAELASLAGRALADGAGDLLVLTVQNGVGHEETLARALGAERVMAGALTAAVSLEGDGSVRVHSRRAGLALAALAPAAATRPASAEPALSPASPGRTAAAEGAVEELARRLARPWFRTAVAQDWAAMKWSKLLLNILGNATAALLDEPPAAALGRPGVFAVERAAFLEALAVMRRRGLRPLSLPGYPVPLLAAALRLPAPLARLLVAPRLAGGRGGKEPSFLLDLRRGRPTEAPFLLGAVADEGRRLGVPTPVSAALAAALERAAADRGFRAGLRGDAEALRRWIEAWPRPGRHTA